MKRFQIFRLTVYLTERDYKTSCHPGHDHELISIALKPFEASYCENSPTLNNHKILCPIYDPNARPPPYCLEVGRVEICPRRAVCADPP